jgi:hypothetical protein
MRQTLTAMLLVAATMSLMAVDAFAGNAHFIKNATDVTLSGSNLIVNFKEAGLQSGSVETITVSAQGMAIYRCYTKSGNKPEASNKTGSVPVSASGTFTADKNGNLVGNLTLSPPGPEGFSCPPGQILQLDSVTYTDVMIMDTTSGATLALSGTFIYTRPGS